MRSTLLLSFLGSAVSYGLLGTTKSLAIILLSRALVGLVKQTSTVTTALLTELTKDDEQARVKAFSTMGAITQFGWFVGPSIGSFLFRRIGFPGVAFISSMMFVVAYVMAFLFLSQSTKTAATAATATRQSLRKREVFSSVNSVLGPIILVLLYSFCQRATSSSSLHNYYESRYNIDSSDRGYIMSYSSLLGLFLQSFVLKKFFSIVSINNGTIFAATLYILSLLVEITSASSWAYLVLIIPMTSMGGGIMGVALKTMISKETPIENISTVLAALDIATSCIGVCNPIWRAFVFRKIGYFDSVDKTILKRWGNVQLGHWIFYLLVCLVLLKFKSKQTKKKRKEE
ncbi:hypothetical protein ScalyP_jg1220 [Parmales sp. scaly parma]|nr:hypothetical protein ScalyP_jg1220 [Parmales sp. scaly parma]